ncbi:MAG: hypothetical protein A3F82_10900 [Deltaproteobacteria bacterium RIFCSPLOWO2_12_FULL_44_12]|nr:MAG: hypothetical protein A2712_08905 [Deltaproteobacteria bacterium RIFCSPHIGHO2_01_FULL_43_49]OGQ14544.1 MAG: hypothetical protein A3D22_08095 [Deltaproteobacteria bacterium RIFCSPHIGHO2_02_FULL_44_53]OGQ27930.1 MAG: hypothetical protein A3D98_06805 [Deltaproteobacteria bacterium RIFCSPHIGHO2_12_FULL_44_21]OGQ31142.1 MAG: hypothetical protein A2979_06855 [Deltaproteobacteria bacterium RIFCSPLOWO2_01_FULL_45_74]OGQ69712.1 MAG: hypothetical protein A3F82_10900 [Deltaproteobacteria bacterium 
MGLFTGCTDVPSRVEPQPNTQNKVDTVPPKEAEQPNTTQTVTRYLPPEQPSFPQVTSNGAIFYSRLYENGQELRTSYPVGLQCPSNLDRCYFGLRNKVFSFSTKSLSQNVPLEVLREADFSSLIDGTEKQLSDILIQGGAIYGLYADQNPMTHQSGMVSRNSNGALWSAPFSDTVIRSPQHLLRTSDGTVWASFSNWIGDDHFGPGKISVLEETEEGVLEETHPVLTTSEFNPQAMAPWNAGDKPYLLVVNTGRTAYPNQTLSESGIDVIDVEAREIVANIPLGLASANTISISSDGKVAFLGSQNLPRLYVLDLEWLAIKINGLPQNNNNPAILDDVALADASNAVPLAPIDTAFIPSIAFDDQTGRLFVSSHNDGRFFQLETHYVPTGTGVNLEPGFGIMVGHYVCAGPDTQNCGDIVFIEQGVIAMTGIPTSVTFYPNERIGRR